MMPYLKQARVVVVTTHSFYIRTHTAAHKIADAPFSAAILDFPKVLS